MEKKKAKSQQCRSSCCSQMLFKTEARKNFANPTGKPQFIRPASHEICKISKNAFFHRTRPVAASDSNSNKISTTIKYITI